MPKYTLELRNPKDAAQTCTDVLIFLAKTVADISVKYGDEGIDSGSELCAEFCPKHMEENLKMLLEIYVPQKMHSLED